MTSLESPTNRDDLRQHDLILGTILGASFAALGLLFNYVAYERLQGTAIPPAFDYLVAITAILLTLAGTRSATLALVALPITAALAIAPAFTHLSFLQEFGSFVIIGIAIRLLLASGTANFRSFAQTAIEATGCPSVIAFAAYVLISLVPFSLLAVTGDVLRAKIVASSMIFETMAISLTFAIAITITRLKTLGIERVMDGLFGLSATVVLISLPVLLIPAFATATGATAQLKDGLDYFGLYYYCRLKLTFFGPDNYSAFLVITFPIFTYIASRNPRLWRGRLALACLYVLPLLLLAGGSRSARIAFLLSVGLTLFVGEFRRVALAPGIFGILFTVPTMGYRCMSDIVTSSLRFLNFLISLYFSRTPLSFSAPSLTGGYVPLSGYFHDSVRDSLLHNAIHVGLNSTIIHIIFGHGAGLAALRQFGLGGHSTVLNVLIDKGLLGPAAIVVVFAQMAQRIWTAWPNMKRDIRLLLYVVGLMFLPIAVAGVIYDVRRWLFTWMMFGLALSVVALAHKSSLHAKPS